MNPVISTMIRFSGRSWWQARYSSGKTLGEWETLIEKPKLPLGITGFGFGMSSRWEEAPKSGMIGLRLLCPNGQAGELEAPEGHRFFQLKSGNVDVGIGGAKGGRSVAAHIIGVVENTEGDCLCRAWESYEIVTCPEYELALATVGHVVTSEDIKKVNDKLAYWRQRGCGKWKWRLTEFHDNIFHMAYRNIGKLEIGVQQVRI